MTNLVWFTLNKIDVEGLKRDINKFREHYPEQAFSFWSDWLSSINKLVTVPDTWEWPLDVLVRAERVKPFTADQSVPEQLRELQEKETQPTKQASFVGLNLGILGCV